MNEPESVNTMTRFVITAPTRVLDPWTQMPCEGCNEAFYATRFAPREIWVDDELLCEQCVKKGKKDEA